MLLKYRCAFAALLFVRAIRQSRFEKRGGGKCLGRTGSEGFYNVRMMRLNRDAVWSAAQWKNNVNRPFQTARYACQTGILPVSGGDDHTICLAVAF
jgi:hypothetical protein